MTILYNNVPFDPFCSCNWGFSCLIRRPEDTILFDAGGNADILERNMVRLGVNPSEISLVVFSHNHSDHTEGLWRILQAHDPLPVCLPSSFPPRFRQRIESLGHTVLLSQGPLELCPGLGVTGPMGTGIEEQALWVKTAGGVAIITGCAHPGIVPIARMASDRSSSPIYLLLGGFHLLHTREKGVQEVIRQLKEIGVRKVSPSHCTGEKAIGLFRESWGEDFIEAGCGAVVSLP